MRSNSSFDAGHDLTRPQRVLITGISGFVGRATAGALGGPEFHVIGASRVPAVVAGLDGIEIRPLPDLQSASEHAVDAMLEGVEHVVHLAAAKTSSAVFGRRNFEADATITRRLAEAARRTITGRFVYMSSVYAQAGAGPSQPVTEATPPQPMGAYGRGKLSAENAVREVFSSDPSRLVILRPAPIYGPGMGGVLALLLKMSMTPFPLPLANASGKRSLVHVVDVAHAVSLAMRARAMGGGTFLVAEPEPLDTAEIVTAFRAGLGRSAQLISLSPTPLLSVSVGKRLFGSLLVDASALRHAGWLPRHNAWLSLPQLAAQHRVRPVRKG